MLPTQSYKGYHGRKVSLKMERLLNCEEESHVWYVMCKLVNMFLERIQTAFCKALKPIMRDSSNTSKVLDFPVSNETTWWSQRKNYAQR